MSRRKPPRDDAGSSDPSFVPSRVARFLTKAEAAELARVCEKTIGRWVEEERFKSSRPIASGSGRRLIDRESFLQFLGVEVVA